MSYLVQNLRKFIQKENISVNALEKKAGLKQSAIQNILQGKSKRPGAEMLASISQALNCSVEDLLKNSEKLLSQRPSQLKIEWNPELYIDCISVTQKYINKLGLNFYADKALKCCEELYKYSLSIEPKIVDERFAHWIITKEGGIS
tara:strand:- start:67 stop:504 length:438 start_codon:yes stop_codon:yes gene_type:complete